MLHKKFTLVGLVFLFLAYRLSAQHDAAQQDYLKARTYFNEGNYPFAMSYFKKLAGAKAKNPFREYATFYYALSAYREGNLGLARSMWLEMKVKHKSWKQIGEVHYWLAKVYFEEGNTLEGIRYAREAKLPAAQTLAENQLATITSLGALATLHQAYPKDKSVAQAYIHLINAQPSTERDFDLLQQLIRDFDFDKTELKLTAIGKSPKKAIYQVAVLLPFMFHDSGSAQQVERNKFVMNLYEGLLAAADTLNTDGVYLKIYPYDTKKSAEVTQKILQYPELQSMDLIIGPLFPRPLQEVNAFSLKNKINMLNPLVTHTGEGQNNPYAFLFKADINTQAKAAAQVAMEHVKNKHALVLYEKSERDSLSAQAYLKQIQAHSFEVVGHIPISEDSLKTLYDRLTEKHEIVYNQAQADSLAALGHMIKQRKSTTAQDDIELYEERFVLPLDSIGHIYVASSKPLHVALLVSALSIRNDSTKIIGRGSWRKFENLTFEEMERLGIYFIDPEFVDTQSPTYTHFVSTHIAKYKAFPYYTAFLGYEAMYYAGRMLKQYGVYFQKAHPTMTFLPGQLMPGVRFGMHNTNQYVPITTFSNTQLTLVNPQTSHE